MGRGVVRVGDQEGQTTVDKLDKQVLGQDRDASRSTEKYGII